MVHSTLIHMSFPCITCAKKWSDIFVFFYRKKKKKDMEITFYIECMVQKVNILDFALIKCVYLIGFWQNGLIILLYYTLKKVGDRISIVNKLSIVWKVVRFIALGCGCWWYKYFLFLSIEKCNPHTFAGKPFYDLNNVIYLKLWFYHLKIQNDLILLYVQKY